MLTAREFQRGMLQLYRDIEPLAALGAETPMLNVVINKLDATNDANLIYHTLTETFADHPKVQMIQTTIPAAVSFRRAATEGIPAHRLEYRLPTYRRSPTAFNTTFPLVTIGVTNTEITSNSDADDGAAAHGMYCT